MTEVMKEALFYRKLDNNRVRCELCPWMCTLSDGQVGVCGVRKNRDGKLYSLNYGLLTATAIDPIEKKPLYHFYPQAPIFSISTVGCNFRCPWCQNWEISQSKVDELKEEEYTPPERIINIMERYNTPFLAFTYNEPLIWYEYVLDTAKLARSKGYKNVLVTNGHISLDPLDNLLPYLDAANVDIKAFNRDTYLKIIGGRLEAVLESTLEMKRKGIHVETTYLVIPGVNDSYEEFKKMVKWHLDNLGPETPLHISRFFPMYKYHDKEPTPIGLLTSFWKIAKEEGILYVYVGNVPGHEGENTYCPGCNKLVIRRGGFSIIEWNLDKNNRCKFCGTKIHIVGEKWKHLANYIF